MNVNYLIMKKETCRITALFLTLLVSFFIEVKNVNAQCSTNAGADKNICVGSSAQLNATGGSFYEWIPGTSLSNPLIANPVASPTITTTYTVFSSAPNGPNLIANPGFESGNTGFSSEHTYQASCDNPATSWTCLYPEGIYYVGYDASLYHRYFFGKPKSGTKYMMVNGSTVANQTVWCQTINSITPNTDYAFSVWIKNLNDLSPAQLVFTVNGQTLSNPILAPSDSVQWIQYYAVWNSGSATTANICVNNNNIVAGGNDFGLDDFAFYKICNSQDDVTVFVNTAPGISLVNQTNNVCFGGNAGAINISSTSPIPTCSPAVSTTTVACSSCALTLSGSGTHAITNGQKACITGSFTGTINMFGGQLVICGTAAPGTLNMYAGEVIIRQSGTLTVNNNTYISQFSTVRNYGTINSAAGTTFNIRSRFENYNTVNITGSVVTSERASVANNYNFTVSSNFTNARYVYNAGTFSVNGTFTNNNGGNFQNSCTANIANFTNSSGGSVLNYKNMTVSGTFLTNAGSVTTQGQTAKIIAATLNHFGTITGPAISCAQVQSTTTHLRSGSILNGFTQLCDVNGIETNVGTVTAPATTGTTCNCTLANSYLWSNNATTEDLSGLIAGTYTVTVTSVGCTASASYTITQPTQITIAGTPNDVSCFGGNNGSITGVSASGGTGTKTFNWGSGITTANRTNLTAGSYTVTVTDANSCTVSRTFTIGQPALLTINISSKKNPSCVNNNNGSINTTVSGGTPGYTFAWSNTPQTTQNIIALGPNTYSVTVTDNKGCTANTSTTLVIADSTAPSITCPQNITPGHCSR